MFVNRSCLRWRNAPEDNGAAKTLYDCWKLRGETEVFLRMSEGLAAGGADRKTTRIDATYLQAHRTASSLAVVNGRSND